jgi:hypothetical protein
MRAITGRRPLVGAPVSDPLEGQLRMRPNPQDPTACLGFIDFLVEVPLLKTGSTGDESAEDAYWSMFHIPVPARFQSIAGIRAHGRILRSAKWLLRKEVIQPHLPVRLPCYDLVLIASPTFDSSLHKGWATGFGCYRLS